MKEFIIGRILTWNIHYADHKPTTLTFDFKNGSIPYVHVYGIEPLVKSIVHKSREGILPGEFYKRVINLSIRLKNQVGTIYMKINNETAKHWSCHFWEGNLTVKW